MDILIGTMLSRKIMSISSTSLRLVTTSTITNLLDGLMRRFHRKGLT